MKHRIQSLALSLLASSFMSAPAAAGEAYVSSTVSSTVSPAGRDIGVGIEVGAPTSINAKFMTASDQGIVVGIGGGIWYDPSISLHGDYLWHPLVAQFNNGSFSGYVGGGLWTSLGFGGNHYGYYQPFSDDRQPFAVGARLPLGLALAFNEVPVEVFVEVVPALEVFPGIGLFGQGGLGARFYF